MHIIKLNNNYTKESISFDALLFILYYFLAPFEDMLNFGAGTILKYIAFMIVAVFLLRSIKKSAKFNFADPLILLPIMLIVLSWVSSLWSIDLTTTFYRNIAYTLLPALFIIGRLKFFNKKEILLLDKAIIFSGICIFIYILWNYSEFLYGSYGRFTLNERNDPNNLAGHLMLPLFLTISNFISLKKKNKFILIIITMMIIFSIIVTGSRGAMLASAIGIIYTIFPLFKGRNRHKALLYLILVVIVMLIISKLIPEYIYTRLFYFDSYIRDFEQYGSRSDIWGNFLKYVMPSLPIWGLGSGTSGLVMSSIYGYLKGVHNTYLNIIMEFGIVGLPLFITFLYKIYKYNSIKGEKNIIGALIAIIVVIFFLDSYPKKFFWNNLMYFAILLSNNNYKKS